MARQPRIDLSDSPQHIVQRGNNRLPCFLDDEDRARYRQHLREALSDEDLAAIRACVRQQRAYGRDDFPRDGGGQDPALRQCATGASAGKINHRNRKVNLTPFFS